MTLPANEKDTCEFLKSLPKSVVDKIRPRKAAEIVRDVDVDGVMPAPRWRMIVVPFDSPPKIEDFGGEQEMIARLRQLLGQNVQCFPFFGVMGKFTEGDHKYFIHPDGRAIPLFDIQQLLTVNSDYYVGNRDDLKIADGRIKKNSRSRRKSSDDDEEEGYTYGNDSGDVDDDDDSDDDDDNVVEVDREAYGIVGEDVDEPEVLESEPD